MSLHVNVHVCNIEGDDEQQGIVLAHSIVHLGLHGMHALMTSTPRLTLFAVHHHRHSCCYSVFIKFVTDAQFNDSITFEREHVL